MKIMISIQRKFHIKAKRTHIQQFNTTKVNNQKNSVGILQAIEVQTVYSSIGVLYPKAFSDTSTNTGGARIIYEYYRTLRKHSITTINVDELRWKYHS